MGFEARAPAQYAALRKQRRLSISARFRMPITFIMVAFDALGDTLAQWIILPGHFILLNIVTAVAIAIFVVWVSDLYKVQELANLKRSMCGALNVWCMERNEAFELHRSGKLRRSNFLGGV